MPRKDGECHAGRDESPRWAQTPGYHAGGFRGRDVKGAQEQSEHCTMDIRACTDRQSAQRDGPAGDAMIAQQLPRHTDLSVTQAMSVFFAALDAGESVLIRPKAAFDGLDRVIETLSRRVSGRLFVTDLESIGDMVESPYDSGTDSNDPTHEPFLAYHTSGSTGSPKCVVYRHDQVRSHATAVVNALRLDLDHAYAALPPVRFAYGLSIATSHHFAGIPVTFTDADWGLPGLRRVSAEEGRPLAVYALPQHTPLLLACALPEDRLARLFIAGGRLSAAAAAALFRRFPAMRLTNMYGQAEMGPRLAVWDGPPADFTEGLIGQSIPGVTLEIASPGGAHGGFAGPLLAKSDHAMTWCLRAPYDKLEAFGGRHEVQPTGDLVTRLATGEFRHEGRTDHIINVAGTKVDVRRIVAIVQEVLHPLLVGVSSRPSRAGDSVPVIEMVPDGPTPLATAPIRRALHAEFGSLAALFDLKYVDRLTPKESGK